MYKAYCDDAKVAYPYSQRLFKEELKKLFLETIRSVLYLMTELELEIIIQVLN